MRNLYAMYDINENLLDVSFNFADISKGARSVNAFNKRNKGKQIYVVNLQPNEDVFKMEDIKFLEEVEQEVLTDEELAKKYGFSPRTLYRKKKMLKENNNDH